MSKPQTLPVKKTSTTESAKLTNGYR